jgi:positive regulator of sigma E activity
MKYVTEEGTVEAVENQTATVQLDHKVKESCGSCCACSSFQSGPESIKVPADGLQEGDRVEVRIPQVNPFLSMLLIFGLPLAFFMGGIAIGQQMQGGARIGGRSVLGGVIGLVVAFAIAWLMNHLLTRDAEPEAHKIASA